MEFQPVASSQLRRLLADPEQSREPFVSFGRASPPHRFAGKRSGQASHFHRLDKGVLEMPFGAAHGAGHRALRALRQPTAALDLALQVERAAQQLVPELAACTASTKS